MAAVDLDSQQFYHYPATKAGLAAEKRFAALNADGSKGRAERNPPTTAGLHKGFDSRLQDHDLIRVLDMDAELANGPLSPFDEPAPNLKDIESDAGGTSNGVYGTGNLNCSKSYEYDGFPSLVDLLSNTKETQESGGAGWRIGLVAEDFQNTIKNGHVEMDAPQSARSQDNPIVSDGNPSRGVEDTPAEREVGSSSSSVYTVDGQTSERPYASHNTLNTQPIFVTDLRPGCSTLHEQITYPTSNPFTADPPSSPFRDGLLLMYGNQMYENNRDHQRFGPDSAFHKEEDLADNGEGKGEEKIRNHDNDRNKPPFRRLQSHDDFNDSEVRTRGNSIVVRDIDSEDADGRTCTRLRANEQDRHPSLQSNLTPQPDLWDSPPPTPWGSCQPRFKYPPGYGPNCKDKCAGSTRGEANGSQNNPLLVQNSDSDSSDDGASKEQDRSQRSTSTPPTSVATSESRSILSASKPTSARPMAFSSYESKVTRDTEAKDRGSSTATRKNQIESDYNKLEHSSDNIIPICLRDLEGQTPSLLSPRRCADDQGRRASHGDGHDGRATAVADSPHAINVTSILPGRPRGQAGPPENEMVEGNRNEAGEEINDSHEKNTSLPRPTKRRLGPVAEEKLPTKRSAKRHRFSSPLSSNEESEEIGGESDISSYTPTDPHRTRLPRPTSYFTGFGGDTSDDSKMAESRQSGLTHASRMAVIYKQQSWEGEIIDEKDQKQGRGRPRKQYLIRWKPSWVDAGHLTAPGLVGNWREEKASSKRRC